MFEAIGQTVKTNDAEALSQRMATPLKQAPVKLQKVCQQEEKSKKENDQPQQVTQEVLEELVKDLEVIHKIGLQFSFHKATGRTMVRVVNEETKELIREIPSEEVLNLAAKMDEMIGMIFDKTV